MASVEIYKDLGRRLISHTLLIYKNAESSGIQVAFKEDGQLNSILKMLEQKDKQLKEYEEKLLGAFDPKVPGSITRDYVNRETAKNEDERVEIKLLQNRLNELSEAVGKSTSLWVRSKAINEFIAGIEQSQKIEKGFFSTLFSVVGNMFRFRNKKALAEDSQHLQNY